MFQIPMFKVNKYVRKSFPYVKRMKALTKKIMERHTREWTLCPDQGEWLSVMAESHGLEGRSGALQKLIDFCNAENNERKRLIFRVIRCHRCSQASMGGKKVTLDLEMRTEQFHWLNNVQEKCNHQSVDKTLRIMLDFYKSTCGVTTGLEEAIFSKKPATHADANTTAAT